MQGNKTQDSGAHLCNQDQIQSTKKVMQWSINILARSVERSQS